MPSANRAFSPFLVAVLLAALVALAYGHSLRNQFALDDAHSIVDNPWVRSLAHAPRYFIDPDTFTRLKPNVDYRPVLQVTYALDYAVSGYDPWSWHATNLALHAWVATALFLLGRRLLGAGGLAPLAGLSPPGAERASLAAAALFAVHPLGSGCACYTSARSSLLVAAFALPSLLLYLRSLSEEGGGRRARLGALALYALALFTKVEAVSLVAVLALAEWLLDPAARKVPLLRRPLRREPWLRLAPFLALTVGYLALWRALQRPEFAAGRAAADMTPYAYLCTQLSAWWYYIGQCLAPTHMIADYLGFPVSRSLAEPRTLLALAGWIAVAAGLLLSARRAPAVAFLGGAFFLWLAPHSSVAPLAEMVNEHRPYLPCAGLFVAAAAGAALALERLLGERRGGRALLGLAVLLGAPLLLLTRERAEVWKDDLTLWADTARKDPESSRAQMNYGLALMQLGRFDEAEGRFREALRLAPYYSYVRINLAICLAARGDAAAARAQYDEGVRLQPDLDVPYFWRGKFRAKQGDLAGAAEDFAVATRLSSAPIREEAALAECLLALGRPRDAEAPIAHGRQVDPDGFEREREAFRRECLGRR